METYIKISIDVEEDKPFRCGKKCLYLKKYNPYDFYCLLFNKPIGVDNLGQIVGNRIIDCINADYK